MGNKIVINRATRRDLQMALPVPHIVGGVISRGLLSESVLRQPKTAMAMPRVALLPDQDEGAQIVDRGQIKTGIKHRQLSKRNNPSMAGFPEARRHKRRCDGDALVEREAP